MRRPRARHQLVDGRGVEQVGEVAAELGGAGQQRRAAPVLAPRTGRAGRRCSAERCIARAVSVGRRSRARWSEALLRAAAAVAAAGATVSTAVATAVATVRAAVGTAVAPPSAPPSPAAPSAPPSPRRHPRAVGAAVAAAHRRRRHRRRRRTAVGAAVTGRDRPCRPSASSVRRRLVAMSRRRPSATCSVGTVAGYYPDDGHVTAIPAASSRSVGQVQRDDAAGEVAVAHVRPAGRGDRSRRAPPAPARPGSTRRGRRRRPGCDETRRATHGSARIR